MIAYQDSRFLPFSQAIRNTTPCGCCEEPLHDGNICWDCAVGKIGCKNCMDFNDICVSTARSKTHKMRNTTHTLCGIRVNEKWVSIIASLDDSLCRRCFA